MSTFNKIYIASEMFIEAHRRYVEAKADIDYVTSILLSGAVLGIISPLLKEQGGHTKHELFARISNAIAEPGDEAAHEGMFREIYNSLKHAGNPKKKVKVAASNDLIFKTNLKKEAAYMLYAAKGDFRNIEVSFEIKNGLPKSFLKLLGHSDDYE